MKRCIVQFNDGGHCNIIADKIQIGGEDEDFIFVYDCGRLVGMFDLRMVLCAYISESKGGVNRDADCML